MQILKTAKWLDLNNISARTAPLLDGLDQCAIAVDGQDRITLLLPSGGLVAILAGPDEPDSVPLMIALGRVVAAHARSSTDQLNSAEILSGQCLGPERRRIPRPIEGNIEVHSSAGSDISQCWLHRNGQAALMILTRDDVMPLVWVNFSTLEPRDDLVIAVARVLVAHRLACTQGRDF